jgi:tRNA G18 (ribose-2'-O)-methylase SpoU
MQEKQLNFQDMRPDSKATAKKIKTNRKPISLLLDRMTDPRNVGGIFRLADAALIEHIYLYKCEGLEITAKIKRISRSTTQVVPYSHLDHLEAVETLKETHKLIALEYTTQSIPYTDFKPLDKTLIVIGNEQRGVSEELLKLTEQSIHLPMLGMNTSMNVMCATGIAVYGLLMKLE